MKFIISLIAISFSINCSAQKVKYKKGLFTVDDVPYIVADCNHPASQPCVWLSRNSESRLFATKNYKYMRTTRKHVGGGNYTNDEVPATYYEINFLEQEKQMITTGSLKGFVKSLAKHGLLDEAGNLVEDQLDDFITIYGEKNPNAIEIE